MVYGAVRVILNADDLGLSEEVNAAVFHALDQGWVRSVSVLANGPAFAGAARGLRARPGTSAGVHLDLTEFAPLLGGEPLCARSLDIPPAQLPHALAEWSAQIQRARDGGILPDHLDSHQHLHYRRSLFPALLAVAKRHGIRAVRGMAAHRLDMPRWRALPQRLRAARFATRLRRAGLWTPDGFGGATLFRALQETGRLSGETFEIMVHPGNPAHAVYAGEMAWVAGGGVRGRSVSWGEALRRTG